MLKNGIIDSGPSGIFGWHAHEAFLRCPHMSQLLRSGARGAPSAPLIRGTLVHIGAGHVVALDSIARHGEAQIDEQRVTDPKDLLPPRDALQMAAATSVDPADWFRWTDIATEAVNAFAVQWALYTRTMKPRVLGIERKLSVLVGPYEYTQRADLIVEEAGGAIFIDDIKTGLSVTDEEVATYAQDGQFLGYTNLGRAHFGEKFVRTRIHAVSFGKGVENGEKKPPECRLNLMVPVSPAMVQAFPRSITWARRQMEELEQQGGDWPRAMSNLVCRHRYNVCEVIDRCRQGGAR